MKSKTTEKPAPRPRKKETTPVTPEIGPEEKALRRKRRSPSYFPEELAKKFEICEKCGYNFTFDEEIEETYGEVGVFRTYKECPRCGRFYAMAGIFEYLDEPPRKDPKTGKWEQWRRRLLWPKNIFVYREKPDWRDTVAWAHIVAKCVASVRLRL